MIEKRTIKRVDLQGMDIHCRMLYAPRADLLDISAGGGRLLTDRRLNIGSDYALNISLDNESLAVKGVVVWAKLTSVRKGVNGDMIPRYEVGIRFDAIYSEEGARLISFLESHVERQEQHMRLRGLRSRLMEDPKGPSVECAKDYEIQRLGMGGVQIRTEVRLRTGRQFPLELTVEGGSVIRFLGRVSSSRENGDSAEAGYTTGIEIVEISPEHLEKLEAFIAALRAN